MRPLAKVYMRLDPKSFQAVLDGRKTSDHGLPHLEEGVEICYRECHDAKLTGREVTVVVTYVEPLDAVPELTGWVVCFRRCDHPEESVPLATTPRIRWWIGWWEPWSSLSTTRRPMFSIRNPPPPGILGVWSREEDLGHSYYVWLEAPTEADARALLELAMGPVSDCRYFSQRDAITTWPPPGWSIALGRWPEE